MKKKFWLFSMIFCLFLALTSTTSCQRKTGCKNTEEYAPKVDRHGNLSTKRGKSTLFSKKMKKKQRN